MTQKPSNDWVIDRQAQKTESYTGIVSIHGQDQAVTERMGPITYHDFEKLGPSDIMIARTPRRLLRDAGGPWHGNPRRPSRGGAARPNRQFPFGRFASLIGRIISLIG